VGRALEEVPRLQGLDETYSITTPLLSIIYFLMDFSFEEQIQVHIKIELKAQRAPKHMPLPLSTSHTRVVIFL
jgi:hypothetical protein